MASDNTGLIFGGLMIIGTGIVLFLKGCDMGIKFFCRKEPVAPVLTEAELYPREAMTTVMEYIANQVVEDIDRNTYTELGRDRLFELKAMLFDKYKAWMEEIAEYNDQRLQPMEGRALAKYAQLILDVSRRAHISLNPAAEARFRALLFAGTPNIGNVTSNRVAIGW
jgi:hypothetical protein